MPPRLGSRPLKAWRYVGVFSPELMVCVASVRIGLVRQSFWAVWDRLEHRLHERTRLGQSGVHLETSRVNVNDGPVQIELALDEEPGIETVYRTGAAYAWTRKQGGIRARGTVGLAGHRHTIAAKAIVDDTAGYHARHTSWRWSAGVGTARDGAAVAWNLVSGMDDPPADSERTVWIDGVAREVDPVRFAPDLSAVEELRFHVEAERARRENLVLVRSDYRQPFGTFSGVLPDGTELAEAFGVMEAHEVRW